jgi:hypothetical protein
MVQIAMIPLVLVAAGVILWWRWRMPMAAMQGAGS